MNPAKRAIARVSEFVSDHKTALTIVTTATATTAVCIVLSKRVKDGYIESANEFLTSKGLMPEFVEAYFEDVN